MKFALVDGQRREAEAGLSGKCSGCGSQMVAKCGEVRIHHWAHHGARDCDSWWEGETEWHRNWKGHFPEDWQEVEHRSESGERHVADVKTDQGRVFEFQYSYLKPEERRAREAFYKKLVWVVSGTRRKRDKDQFAAALRDGLRISQQVWKIHFPDECRLFQEWAGGIAPVFFDFGDAAVLWWLYPKSTDGSVFVGAFPRAELVEIHRTSAVQALQTFDAFVNELPGLVEGFSAHLRAVREREYAPRPTFSPSYRRRPRL